VVKQHIDIYYVIGAALVLLILVRLAAKMFLSSIKWTLYGLIAVATVIYVVVRTR
jgi:hypothetical protein